MSQLLINDYLKQLNIIKKVSGSQRETIVREAFKDLLKSWGKQQDLIFLAEYPLKTATKSNITVDGALLHELRMPLGYWEAKDADDDLNNDVSKKLKKGYPQDNIIFSDDAIAVLWQNRSEVLRCDMTDTKALASLLKLFFSFERPEIANFRAAVEQFKGDLPAVLKALREMIDSEYSSNPTFRAAELKFLVNAQEAINPSLTAADVREMLIQHILTEEIFSKVFDESDFHQHNNVARELYALEAEFFTGSLKKDTLKGLEPYYAAIRAAAAQIVSHGEKQTFLKVIYENFYRVYNTKAADRLGVIYTPNEVVRFMIDGTDWLCEKYFQKNLIDKDVDVLDPATGTGTFICELLEHFRGQPKKLAYKYTHELHANEVAILPYYVANLNIESTYAGIAGSYQEFPNLCFVDTLDNVGLHTAAKGVNADLFGSVSEENVARIKRQNSRKISVVIGNPPYYANQANENHNNKSREYPGIDKRIKQTYIAESAAQKTKLYDMYARFFRWASDRLNENGILCLVTNRSFIDSRTFDGFRKIVAQEYSDIYIVDLGGDIRANKKLSGTKHNVFGIKTGVAISFMVKRVTAAKDKQPARVHYLRRPEMETSEEKLAFLASNQMSLLNFDEVRPDAKGNWIRIGDDGFEEMLPLASKATKAAKSARGERAIFKLFSLGASTNRDEWLYAKSESSLTAKIRYLVEEYQKPKPANEFSDLIKWSRNLKRRRDASRKEAFDPIRISRANYRPYNSTFFYNSDLYVDEVGSKDLIFPNDSGIDCKNELIMFCGHPQIPLAVHAVDGIPDAGYASRATQTFPRWIYQGQERVDNITDWALKQFKARYADEVGKGKGARKITKQGIFHYCYAVLHDPLYRSKYEHHLKREFPRIPFYAEFWKWAVWGEFLMSLHIGYKQAAPFELIRTEKPDEKARAAGLSPKVVLVSDRTTGCIKLDSETTLSGVPSEAWGHVLGIRSSIDWVLDQSKEKKPKDPTILKNFNTYRFADFKENVIDLLMRVTTVSVETMKVVEAMRATVR
jgi:predicted helicase